MLVLRETRYPFDGEEQLKRKGEKPKKNEARKKEDADYLEKRIMT